MGRFPFQVFGVFLFVLWAALWAGWRVNRYLLTLLASKMIYLRDSNRECKGKELLKTMLPNR
jgi:hypothetical protein